MSTPLERSIVMPSQWGARVDTTKPWPDDKYYKPRYSIVHYGGGANPAGEPPFSQSKEMAVLRAWEAWHMNPKRPQGQMRALAYNYAVGQSGTLFWGRGDLHSNGGQYGAPNRESRAVVFILGGDQTPTPRALTTFSRLWLEEPLEGEVKRHSDVGATECPGAWLWLWVDREGWIDSLGEHKQGDVSPVVSSIKVRLHRLGYRLFPSYGPRFDKPLGRQVRRFQERHGLKPDGIVGAETLRRLGGMYGEVFLADHSQEPTEA